MRGWVRCARRQPWQQATVGTRIVARRRIVGLRRAQTRLSGGRSDRGAANPTYASLPAAGMLHGRFPTSGNGAAAGRGHRVGGTGCAARRATLARAGRRLTSLECREARGNAVARRPRAGVNLGGREKSPVVGGRPWARPTRRPESPGTADLHDPNRRFTQRGRAGPGLSR
jgi:hypothetical protein